MSKKPDWMDSIYNKAIGDIDIPLHPLTDEEAEDLKERFIEEAADDPNYNEKNPKHSKSMDRVQDASSDLTATAGRNLKDQMELEKLKDKYKVCIAEEIVEHLKKKGK